MKSASTQRPTWLIAIFLVLAIFIVLAPAAHQFFGISSRHLPNWAMFNSASLGQFRVHYFEMRDGEKRSIDRVQALGLSGHRPNQLTITSKSKVFREGAQLCKTLRASDIRAEVQRSTMDGWRPVRLKGGNLCSSRSAK